MIELILLILFWLNREAFFGPHPPRQTPPPIERPAERPAEAQAP